MKKVALLLPLLFVALSVAAQSADSLALVSACRHKLRLRKAEGYTLCVNLFNSPQTISVIKYSPKLFSLGIIQPEQRTCVGDVAEQERAVFAINAGYWNRNNEPSTYVKSRGAEMSLTHPGMLPRVNGLLFMNDSGIEIVCSEDAPEYSSLVDRLNACENILACGPVLLDDGKKMSYDHITSSTDKVLKRKGVFFVRRHPRSAIGCDREGNIYLVVVDGRAAGKAAGMSIKELTELCSWLGMVEAMNLDGGGSSTLWSRKYGVINYPCDNKTFDHEGSRKVSSTLVVKPKKRR